jgi:hypothetical protein
MPQPRPRVLVTVLPKSMWRLRLARELPRYVLAAAALAGLLASARFAIAPPRPSIERAPIPSGLLADRAAEGFATLFARRYLTWDARDPEAHQRALAPLLGSWMEADAGFQPPPSGSQHVQWTQIVQSRSAVPGERVYTVAAQTDTSGLLYLTVSVRRDADGSLGLASYPALVGAPAVEPSPPPAHGREVEDRALASVVTRALRNYLASSPSELAADLIPSARVSLPGVALALQAVHSLELSPDGRSVVAVVQAQDSRGAQYTLAYELDVVPDAGRWEVAAIQMDPDQ